MMLEARAALIAILLPNETPSKAMQRLKPKPKQAVKKKNIRKSELLKMQQEAANGTGNQEMEDMERKKQFDSLVSLISEL